MGIQEEGIEAEQWLLNELRGKCTKVFQPDAISLEDGEWVVNEVKHQERFTPPPFEGHGLPKWQVEARLWFYEATDIRPILFIIEKPTNLIFYQFLDVLEKSEYFDTKGMKPRRIYNLKYFIGLGERTTRQAQAFGNAAPEAETTDGEN